MDTKNKQREVSIEAGDLKKLNFTAEKITKTYEEIFEKAYCNVCFKFHDVATKRKHPYPEKGMEMLICSGCNVFVHLYCYGLKTPITEVSISNNKKICMFVCDKCGNEGPKAEKECKICKQKSGAFKRVKNNVYVHLICALFSNLYEIQDFQAMNVQMASELEENSPSIPKICEYCSKPGGIFKCSKAGCNKAVHLYCAYMNKIDALAEDEESTDGWSTRVDKEGGSSKSMLSLEDNRVIIPVTKRYKSYLTAWDKFHHLVEKGENVSSYVPKTFDGVSISKEEENLLKEACLKVKRNLQETTLTEELVKYTTQGCLKVECNKHRTRELYCICKQPYDEDPMSGCEACDNWFHHDCIGVSEEIMDKVQNYYCKQCRQWVMFRKLILNKLPPGKPYETIDKSGVVPKATARFNIQDFIILAILLQQQLATELKETNDIKQVMIKAIDSVKYIPFNLNGLLQNLVVRFQVGQVLDKTLTLMNALEKVENPDIAFDLENNEFNKEVLSKQLAQHEYLSSLYKMYLLDGLIKTEVAQKIAHLLEIYKWHIDAHNTITACPMKYEAIIKLRVRAEKLNIDQETPEIKYLNKKKAEFDEWVDKVREIFQEKAKTFENKIIEFESTKSQELTLNKALEENKRILDVCIEVLKLKPTQREIEDLVNKGQEINIEAKELKKLREELKMTELLQQRLNKNHLDSVDTVKSRMNEVQETTILFPETLEVFSQYEKIKTLEIKLKWYARLLSSQKKHGSMETEDDEEDLSLLELREIHETIRQADEINLKGEDYKTVQKILKEIEEFQKEFRKCTEGPIDLEKLESLNKRAKKFKIRFEEMRTIEEKVIKGHKLRELAQKVVKLQNLKEIEEEYRQSFSDKFAINLKTRLDKGYDLEKKARELLSQDVLSEEDIGKCQEILRRMELISIELEEKEDLVGLEKSVQWLTRLYIFLNKLNSRERNNGVGQKEKKKKEDREEEHGQSVSIEKMVQFCMLDRKEKLRDFLDIFYEDYSTLLEAGQAIKHRDKRIEKVFQSQAKTYWIFQAAKILEKPEAIRGEEIAHLYEQANKLGISSLDPTYLLIKEKYRLYRDWTDKVTNLVSSERFESIVKEIQEDGLDEDITRLLDEHSRLGINVEIESKILKKANIWLKWSSKANQILEIVEQGNKIAFEGFQELFSYADVIKIPKESPIYKKIESIYIEHKNLRDSLEDFNKKKKEVKDKLNSLQEISDPKQKKKEVDELCTMKPELEMVRELEKGLTCSIFYVKDSELEELRNDIQQCEIWSRKVERFIGGHELNNETLMDSKKVTEINRGIIVINNEMAVLVLRDVIRQREVYNLEWKLRAGQIFSRKGDEIFKMNNIEHWRDLRNLAHKTESEDVLESELFREVQNQITVFEGLNRKIQDLLKQETFLIGLKNNSNDLRIARDKLLSEEEIAKILEELRNCKVDVTKEKKWVTDLLEKAKKAVYVYEEIKESTDKIPMDKVATALEQLIKIPIKYPEEEKMLELWLEKAKKLQKLIYDEKMKHADTMKLDIKVAEAIYNEYKDCNIIITDAKNISKFYVEGKKTMEELEKALEKKGSLSFDDLQNLSRRADDIKVEIEPRLEQIKRKLWIQKVHLLKSYRENKTVPNNPIPFTQLKNCLLEGYEHLSSKEAIHELRSGIQYTEHLMKEIENYLNKLSSAQDSKMLEGIEYTLYNFIDIREEIIDYKAQAAIASTFDSHMSSIVRNLGDKDDEEIIAQRKIKKKVAEVGERKLAKKTPGKKGKDMEGEASIGMLIGKRKSMMMKPKERDSEHQHLEDLAVDKHDKLNKMIKKDAESSVKKSVEKKHSRENREVIDEDRKKARKRLLEALNENHYFSEVLHREEIAKDVEMNIFLELSQRHDKYEKKVRRIASMLYAAREYKMISNKLMNTNFSYAEIKNMRKRIDLKELEKELREEAANDSLRSHIIATQKEMEKADLLDDEFKIKSKKISFDSTDSMKEEKEKSQSIPPNGKAQLNQESGKTSRHNTTKIVREGISKMDIAKEHPMKAFAQVFGNKIGGHKGISSGEKQHSLGFEDSYKDHEEKVKDNSHRPKKSFESQSMEEKDKQSWEHNNFKEANNSSSQSKDSGQQSDSLWKFDEEQILMIFDGNLKHDLINKGSKESVRCSFYTCENYETVKRFPKFSHELNVAGRVQKIEALKFVDKIWRKPQSEGTEKHLFFGWVCAKERYQEHFRAIAKNLVEKGKIASITYENPTAGIYLVPPSDVKGELEKKYNWRARSTQEYRLEPLLFFVVYLKGTFVFGQKPPLEPIVIGPALSDKSLSAESKLVHKPRIIKDKTSYESLKENEKRPSEPKAFLEAKSIDEVTERVSPHLRQYNTMGESIGFNNNNSSMEVEDLSSRKEYPLTLQDLPEKRQNLYFPSQYQDNRVNVKEDSGSSYIESSRNQMAQKFGAIQVSSSISPSQGLVQTGNCMVVQSRKISIPPPNNYSVYVPVKQQTHTATINSSLLMNESFNTSGGYEKNNMIQSHPDSTEPRRASYHGVDPNLSNRVISRNQMNGRASEKNDMMHSSQKQYRKGSDDDQQGYS